MGGRGAGGSTSGEWVRRRVGAGRGAGKCFIRRRSAAGREKIVIKFGSRHDFLCFGICFCVPYAAYEVGTDIDKNMSLDTLEPGGTQFGFRRNLAKSSGKMSLGTLEPTGTQFGFRRNLAKILEICGLGLNGT
jgi:hypothetical protein